MAVALALALLRSRLAALFEGTRPLVRFPDRAIGMTTLYGVDVSGLVRNYVVLYTLLVIVILLFWLGLRAAPRWLERHLGRHASLPEQGLLARLSELWIALELLLLGRLAGYTAAAANVVGSVVALVTVLLLARVLLSRHGVSRQVVELLENRPLLVGSGLLSLALPFGGWALSGLSPSLHGVPAVGWLAIVASTWSLLLVVAGRLGGRAGLDAAGSGRLLAAGAPLVLVPVSLPLANELQYRFSSWAPETLSRLFVLGLCLASVAVYRLARGVVPKPWRLLHGFYYPTVIASAQLLRIYRHTHDLGKVDLFHLGETMVPAQQLFRFGQIPLLDVLPAHTFSDMAYQTLYSLVHGYHGLDMEIWVSWMPRVVALVLLYFVLARVVSPNLALLASAFLPMLKLLTEYYAIVLLPALLLAAALRRPSGVRMALLGLGLLGLAAWRIDFGVAGGIAALLVLVGHSIPWRRAHLHRARVTAAAFGAVVAGAIVSVTAFLLLWGRSLDASLSQLSSFYGSRLLTRTRPELFAEYDILVVLQYYLLPAVALVLLVAFAGRRLSRRRTGPVLGMVAFLAAFSLMLSTRSLERHSLVEAFNPYLFVFLLVLLPFVVCAPGAPRERAPAWLAFLTIVVASMVVLAGGSGMGRPDAWNVVDDDGELFRFRRFDPDERRVWLDDTRQRGLVRFLTEQLRPGETFFDFSNSPLLYVLADKRLPTYVIPNLAQTGEAVQRRVVGDLTAELARGQLPFVVFKQGDGFWDRTDGVPNEVRSYRIAELVYERYEPLARFGGYEVWRDRAGRSADELLAPYVTRRDLTPRGPARLHAMEAVPGVAPTFRTTGVDPYIHGLLDFSDAPALEAERSWSLDVEYASSVTGNLRVFLGLDGSGFSSQAAVSGWLRSTANGRLVMAIDPGAEPRRLTDLRFDPPDGSTFSLVRVGLLGSSVGVVPLPADAVSQRFDLMRLPWLWANHDPLDALRITDVVATLATHRRTVAPGAPLSLSMPRSAAATARYLRLCVKPVASQPGPWRLELAYGENDENVVGFEVSQAGPRRRVELPRRSDFQGRAVSSFTLPGDRLVFEATGPEPQIDRLFDLASVPPVAADEEVWLEVAYRARGEGEVRVSYGEDGGRIIVEQTRDFLVATTEAQGPPAIVRLLLMTAGSPRRLTDLRFEPPVAGLLEIATVRVELRPAFCADHLVRMSTQWAWWSRPPSRLLLRATAPIDIEAVDLRTGD